MAMVENLRVEIPESFQNAIVMVKGASLRNKVVSELRNHGASNIVFGDNPDEIVHYLIEFPQAILILDYKYGDGAVVKVLEKSRSKFKADVRPMYLICSTIDLKLMALATDYNILRMRGGQVSDEDISKDIRDIFRYEDKTQDSRSLFREVASLRSQGKWNKAGSMLVNALKANKSNVMIKVELAENLIVSGKIDSANKIISQVLKKNPNHTRAMSLLARICMKKGDFARAGEILEKVQVFNPKNVDRLVDLGKCFLHQDNTKGANQCFDEALSVNSENHDAKAGKSQVSLVQGDIDTALSFLKESTDEEVAALFNNSAVICMKHSRFEDGIHLYNTARKQVGERTSVLARVVFNMGLGYLRWDKPDEAKAAFKESAQLDPEFMKALHNARVMEKKEEAQSKAKVKSTEPSEESLEGLMPDDDFDEDLLSDDDVSTQLNDDVDSVIEPGDESDNPAILAGDVASVLEDIDDLLGPNFDSDDALFDSLADDLD